MKHLRTRALLAGAEAEARGDGAQPLSAALSSRWESLLAVLRDANADMLLHASMLSLLAASGYALADVSRAFLSLHPRFTSTLYVAVVRPRCSGWRDAVMPQLRTHAPTAARRPLCLCARAGRRLRRRRRHLPHVVARQRVRDCCWGLSARQPRRCLPLSPTPHLLA